MDKNKITTKQYATIHRDMNIVKRKALIDMMNNTTDEYARSVIESTIDGYTDWIDHYNEMLYDLNE